GRDRAAADPFEGAAVADRDAGGGAAAGHDFQAAALHRRARRDAARLDEQLAAGADGRIRYRAAESRFERDPAAHGKAGQRGAGTGFEDAAGADLGGARQPAAGDQFKRAAAQHGGVADGGARDLQGDAAADDEAGERGANDQRGAAEQMGAGVAAAALHLKPAAARHGGVD